MGNKPKGHKRLYECEECSERRFVCPRELNRAGRPRCYGCGSARLELVSEEAKDDRARLNVERIAGDHGSLRLAGALKNPHHKVV